MLKKFFITLSFLFSIFILSYSSLADSTLEKYNNAMQYENKFPDVFSKSELDKMVHDVYFEGKYINGHYICKQYFTKNGVRRQVTSPKDVTIGYFLDGGDTIEYYIAWLSTSGSLQTQVMRPTYVKSYKPGYEKLILPAEANFPTQIVHPINNDTFFGNPKDIVFKNNTFNLYLGRNDKDKVGFAKFEFKIPDNTYITQLSENLRLYQNTYRRRHFGTIKLNFHYVNDITYRRKLGYNGNEYVKQRGEDDPIDPNTPFIELDLPEIEDTYESVSPLMSRKVDDFFDNKLEHIRRNGVPLLRDPKMKLNDDKLHYFYEPSETGIGYNYSRIRPSHSDLTINIDGYVYSGDDIDTDKGGTSHQTNQGILNNSLVNSRHYYLRYRPIPTALNIKVIDYNTKKIIDNANFDIYYIDSEGKETLVQSIENKGDWASYNLPKYFMLKNMVKNDSLATIHIDKNIVSEDNNIAFFPGKFIIKEKENEKDKNVIFNNYEFEIALASEENFQKNIQINAFKKELKNDEDDNIIYPKTGDNFNFLLPISIIIFSISLFFIIKNNKRKTY